MNALDVAEFSDMVSVLPESDTVVEFLLNKHCVILVTCAEVFDKTVFVRPTLNILHPDRLENEAEVYVADGTTNKIEYVTYGSNPLRVVPESTYRLPLEVLSVYEDVLLVNVTFILPIENIVPFDGIVSTLRLKYTDLTPFKLLLTLLIARAVDTLGENPKLYLKELLDDVSCG